MDYNNTNKKSDISKKEEEILSFWQQKDIFNKSLKKPSPKGEFVFYEGPPTANGRPGIHHMESRSFKDIIPRYKTMKGYHVPRKGGWDTHGLPVELEVEKQLGISSKKDIEEYGIGPFNEKCKESVWKYIDEWKMFTHRIAFWVDLENPYITYETDYIESLWYILSEINHKKFLYKDYKVVPWCPRCGTALSSHELAQGYQDIKDTSLYVKFKLKNKENEYLLAWTTTPWTLPANVALAVGKDIKYIKVKIDNEFFILAKERANILGEKNYEIIDEFTGEHLAGLEYDPLYSFIKNQNIKNIENGWKVYTAPFVTTEDGTGIVHTAVMYGQDDFDLGNSVNLPKLHIVKEDGRFIKSTGELSGKFVKDEDTEVLIIKYLHQKGLLFKKEKYEHSYPHCWRCKTPLIYYARDSWYINMQKVKKDLIKENESINWEPEHIKYGRFGEWLKDVKDWAISRERYWGTPLPVWMCEKCNSKTVIGSRKELYNKSKQGNNKYILVRHGEAESNLKGIVSSKKDNPHHLTEKGKKQVEQLANNLKNKKIDIIFSSPFLRTKETAEHIAKSLGLPKESIIFDNRIGEINTGKFNMRPISEYRNFFNDMSEKFTKKPDENSETLCDVKKRVGEFILDLEKKYKGKNILIVSHEYPIWMFNAISYGWTNKESIIEKEKRGEDFIKNAEITICEYKKTPHDKNFNVDLHRPYIDEIRLLCSCGNEMERVKEVIDVWFDSGGMPYAQHHYPFENNKNFNPKKGLFKKQKGFPADYIAEAIDQTRGWFYTLHATGVLLGFGKAYKNVISVGHILDEKGKKMSKSLGNIINPWDIINKYGVDAVRMWMYSVNNPGDPKNFDERSVDEVVKKVINPLLNSVKFYELNLDKDTDISSFKQSNDVLDRWILSKLSKLIHDIETNLDNFKILKPSRSIKEFITDLSTWYIRRSRDRFKNDEQKKEALHTLQFVLITFSKAIAPFMPYISEDIFQRLKNSSSEESVHLSDWPSLPAWDEEIILNMETVRLIVEEALSKRQQENIKVRQPLAKITLKNNALEGKDEFLKLIADEINVKKIEFNPQQDESVKLDTNITEELLEEGLVREIIRNIQSLRKESKLIPGQNVDLIVSGDDSIKKLINKFLDDIKLKTNISSVIYKDNISGKHIKDGKISYTLKLKI